ncbi:EGF-like domain protein, partial [Teladorsagia circumcincta]
DIPVGSCGSDSYFGLGMMNGTLEECERWQLTDPAAVREYEEYKCKHLRVHARMHHGKCVCEPKWKGPICNEFEGCPEGHALHGKVCTANVCQHDGTLAVGKKEIECICEVPWDGRYCDRLACWRKTKFGVSAKKAMVEKCARRDAKKDKSQGKAERVSVKISSKMLPDFLLADVTRVV